MWKGFLTGLVVANAFEWFAHKYILHGTHRPGKPRYSPVPHSMKSHWEHHREVRKTEFSDHGYVEGWQNWRTRNEIGSLAVVFGLAFYPVSKGLTLATVYSACNYYYIHRRAHLEPTWAMKKIPWHYDHHMNSNQDANWCVTKPWFDYVMGTRVISSFALKEQNPIGVVLPQVVSGMLNNYINLYRKPKMISR